jgi:prepilin-type N-terminal cleavage/methylation domain-containing protein
MSHLARSPTARRGFTLLEVIVAVAMLGILLAIGATSVRPPAAQTYASSLRNMVLQARFEAIKRNAPVVVGWVADEEEFVARLAGQDDWCTDLGDVIIRSNAIEIARLQITTTVTGPGSLVWVPSGQSRNCGRAPFTPDFATIEDGRNARTVRIGAAGRVEIE